MKEMHAALRISYDRLLFSPFGIWGERNDDEQSLYLGFPWGRGTPGEKLIKNSLITPDLHKS